METQKSEDTQQNAEETNKQKSNLNEEIFKSEMIDGTPFTVIETEEHIFTVMGNHRITEKLNKKEINIKEYKKEVEVITWDRILQVIAIMNEQRSVINEMIKK